MKQVDIKLPEWISRQASLGPNVDVDGQLNDENAFWYLLTMCCPLIFESYAIILHPFWINWKLKELADSGLTIIDEQVDKEDFKRISWSDFFKLYNKEFSIETAYKTEKDLSEEVSKHEWPKYLWFPSEGDCEIEELEFVNNKIMEIHGDDIVNFYYCFLKSQNWDDDRFFRGSLSELVSLHEIQEIRDNPTAIYPDSKDWSIITDYDLQFTYIGGSKELIDNIVKNSSFEIFKINPKFKEKTPAHNKV